MRPMASYGVVDYGSVGDVEQWCIYSDSIERCRCVVGSIINDHWSELIDVQCDSICCMADSEERVGEEKMRSIYPWQYVLACYEHDSLPLR